MPPPGPGEVQIAIEATTLCGSDLHYYNHGANGAFKVLHPYILGHEAGGTITRVGEGVTGGLTEGTKVAIECGIMCGRCDRCKEGRYNLCPQMEFKCVFLEPYRFQCRSRVAPDHRRKRTRTLMVPYDVR